MRLLIVFFITFSSVSHAGQVEEVRVFFENFVARSNAFDVGVVDVYAPEARIITLRDGEQHMEMSGSQWKELLLRLLPMAEKRGDTSTFDDVKISQTEKGFRVTAVRYSNVKCVSDPNYHLDVVHAETGWQVVEEYTETVTLSQCEPSVALASALNRIRDGIIPYLPLDLDEDTRLETVEVFRTILTYNQRLHTISVDELDVPQFTTSIQQLQFQNTCGRPDLKTLGDLGATLRYSYIDREGTKVVDVTIFPGLCL